MNTQDSVVQHTTIKIKNERKEEERLCIEHEEMERSKQENWSDARMKKMTSSARKKERKLMKLNF